MKPRLLEVLQGGYSLKTFGSDLVAGLIVGVVAIPLAVAFAIASGVSPEKGLLTAAVAGFVTSVLGGSNVQIGGPTGAFIVIVYGVLTRFGPDGLLLATLMAAVILLVLGWAKLGAIIQFVPYPVIVGFTAGIALIIFSSQINDFLGLGLTQVPADFLEKWALYLSRVGNTNFWALGLAAGTIGLTVLLRRLAPRVPASLVALVAGTLLVLFFRLPVETIGSRFGEISGTIPIPALPASNFDRIRELLLPAFSIAMLAGIESLLSAVVADGLTGGRHNSNQELVGQGFANLASALFGGLPATGAIARTATNIRSGGKTPVAGIVHAVFLLLVLLLVSPLTALIPLSVLAGILATVSYNMSGYGPFWDLVKGPKGEMAVLVATFLLTVLVDLTLAIPVGILVAFLVFIRQAGRSTRVTVQRGEIREATEGADPLGVSAVPLPDGVEVFEIEGPFFFGAAERVREALVLEAPVRVRILRFRRVGQIDSSGVEVLKELADRSRSRGEHLLFASVAEEVQRTLLKTGFVERAGADHFLPDLFAALERAHALLGRHEPSLTQSLHRGGVFVVTGATPVEVIRNAAERFPLSAAQRPVVRDSMLERELLASTALGGGVAFVHTRNPIPEVSFVAVAYLSRAVAWGAADGQPVTVVFFLAAGSVSSHLKTLSTLVKLSRAEGFRRLLDGQAPVEDLVAWIDRQP